MLAKRHLRFFSGIVVGGFSHDGWNVEVECGRRRGRLLPLQSFCVPRITGCYGALSPRPGEIDHRNQITDAKNGSPSRRHDMQYLKFRRVRRITPWGTQVTQNELREEGQVESDKHYESCELGPALGIQATCDFGKPEVDPAKVRHHHSADHDVMEMRD